MGFLNWLLGNESSQPSSSASCPAHIDLKSDADRVVEAEASLPFNGDLEKIAELVGRLGHEYQNMGDSKWQQMQAIGRQLNERGGLKLMQRVCTRAGKLGGRASSVSAAWNGIGEWQN